jgi:hypothetical protein
MITLHRFPDRIRGFFPILGAVAALMPALLVAPCDAQLVRARPLQTAFQLGLDEQGNVSVSIPTGAPPMQVGGEGPGVTIPSGSNGFQLEIPTGSAGFQLEIPPQGGSTAFPLQFDTPAGQIWIPDATSHGFQLNLDQEGNFVITILEANPRVRFRPSRVKEGALVFPDGQIKLDRGVLEAETTFTKRGQIKFPRRGGRAEFQIFGASSKTGTKVIRK